MSKGYKTLSINDEAYERSMTYYKVLQPRESFSKWISGVLDTANFIGYEKIRLTERLEVVDDLKMSDVENV